MAINTAYTASVNAQTVSGSMTGTVTYGATAIVATDYSEFLTGFKPKYVKFTNLTDRTTLEWYEGMATNTWLKTIAAGTVTLDTTAGALQIFDHGFRVLQNATLGLILASKQCAFIAQG